MTYYKVINRATRNEQIFSKKEMENFFYSGLEKGKKPLNNWRDYAVSQTLSPKHKALNNFIDAIAISCFSLAFVILITEIVRDNFTIL